MDWVRDHYTEQSKLVGRADVIDLDGDQHPISDRLLESNGYIVKLVRR